jgi:hypothetical protein
MLKTPIKTMFVLGAFCLLTTPATAQMDWMKKGQDMLGGFGKSDSKESGSSTSSSSGLSLGDMGAGLKDALKVGTETVVGKLGTNDGFNADPAIRIPLPKSLEYVQTTLNRMGMGSMVNDLQTRLNRAAETATPKAKELFFNAISEMTLDDVKKIYNGPQDSATKYFQSKMTGPLGEAMRPVIDSSLSQVGAIQSYDKVMNQYKAIPFVPDVKANLTNHVIEKGISGIFYYLAKEEAAIRQNPAKRTTDLLKKVFGGS